MPKGSHDCGSGEQGAPSCPCIMVVFGASGDLTKRKLLPALYNLAAEKLLPEEFAVVGFGRRTYGHEDFRKYCSDALQEFLPNEVDAAVRDWLIPRLYFHAGNFDDAAAFEPLKSLLACIDKERNTGGNYLFYMATSPEFFGEIARQLNAAGLTAQTDGKTRRLVVEKPFGRDLASAKALNSELLKVVTEKQIYRIDHYLGKETVQNILAFRFGNGIFEPIWNRRYIEHVQITVAETVGVEMRGDYYDKAGALRDMLPNHLFQLVTLMAMEPPSSFDADIVREEQTKVLRALPPMNEAEVLAEVVRGQYGAGEIAGAKVPAYRSEPNVPPQSATETFLAMKLKIENWRWADVPFFLRTGKRLKERITEIVIQFRRAPLMLFHPTQSGVLPPNQLVLNIQPMEGISIKFNAKVPGPIVNLQPVNMNFRYQDYFKARPSTGYERLLYDAMIGDATLFQRADTVEIAWSVVQPVLDSWSAHPPANFPNYAAGSWGPREVDLLIAQDGRPRSWCNA
ncbi:MAG TPA: glucose-6-phosphate dehydrogenase [Candidatus Acidoferrales bacterium]|nr:glucose-6-phosphate dehydrogenase [Candidatus Acidoferrales bacterium]